MIKSCAMMPLATRPAYQGNRLWSYRSEIRIAFISQVSTGLKNKVRSYIEDWLEYADGLSFYWPVDARDTDVRISFFKGGSWSYVGTDCKSINRNMPTMNFGWFNDDTEEDEIRRVTLHEAGHMLGMIHEHQNPANEIQWNKKAVYEHYKKMGWSKKEVDKDIFEVYDRETTTHSVFNPTSIMCYPIPVEFTLNGYSVGWNTELSQLDKDFARKIYGG